MSETPKPNWRELVDRYLEERLAELQEKGYTELESNEVTVTVDYRTEERE